jgi:hypothetical protein
MQTKVPLTVHPQKRDIQQPSRQLSNPSWQVEHTLLIFKKGIKLENHIFSDDAVYIDVEVNDMTAPYDNDEEEIEVMGNTLFWCITVAGGSKLASGRPKKGKKLFKSK